eukprot:694647-Prorocentrum_minimum.AAC.1
MKKNNSGGQTPNSGPPCKFCPGLKHWHRNCPKLKEMEDKLEREPPRFWSWFQPGSGGLDPPPRTSILVVGG